MALLAYLSPAKSLRFGESFPLESTLPATQPRFLQQSAKLAKALKAYDARGLETLMEISPKLAELNASRFHDITKPLDEAVPECRRSLFCFDGDAYEGMRPENLDARELARLANSVRFLSGYYGLLRPTDLMRAYRLEMGRKPDGIGAPSLVAFWGKRLAAALADDIVETGAAEAVCLASDEYDAAASPHWISAAPLHRTRFETSSAKGRKVVSFDAKRARGLFARHIAISGAETMAEAAEGFAFEGWAFESKKPSDHGGFLWTFVSRK